MNSGEMESITEANIETFRSGHETLLQWGFRRKFLLQYANEHPTERLECWSNILSNVKFYGCSYHQDVLDRLNVMLENMGESPVEPRSAQPTS